MTDLEKWDAVVRNDEDADGRFYYAVRSTGIFCRPSCRSRNPARENVLFFDCREEAAAAGYRPCKRCRPDLAEYRPAADLARLAKGLIDEHYGERERLSDELQTLGVSKSRLAQIFKQQYGLSPSGYANTVRMKAAEEQLSRSDASVTEIAYSLGFETLSAFFTLFRRSTGMTPREYRMKGETALMPAGLFGGVYGTVFGPVTVAGSDRAIVSVQFGEKLPFGMRERRNALTDRAAFEIDEYFSGQRQSFDVTLAPEGTVFQKSVWEALGRIPYGETRTYGDIAKAVGNPNASRAVGMANNKNPILILIPCHRVVGANGALVGYAGGLEIKEKLLRLESEHKPQENRWGTADGKDVF